jgi:hypothetical protein
VFIFVCICHTFDLLTYLLMLPSFLACLVGMFMPVYAVFRVVMSVVDECMYVI